MSPWCPNWLLHITTQRVLASYSRQLICQLRYLECEKNWFCSCTLLYQGLAVSWPCHHLVPEKCRVVFWMLPTFLELYLKYNKFEINRLTVALNEIWNLSCDCNMLEILKCLSTVNYPTWRHLWYFVFVIVIDYNL